MLAFYHKYNPTELRLLPVVPFFQRLGQPYSIAVCMAGSIHTLTQFFLSCFCFISYAKNRYICDLPAYSPGGSQVCMYVCMNVCMNVCMDVSAYSDESDYVCVLYTCVLQRSYMYVCMYVHKLVPLTLLSQVGPPTGLGIWDANSWGQYIGGTSKKRGKDKVCMYVCMYVYICSVWYVGYVVCICERCAILLQGFMDSSHITGQAIGSSHCRISFICGNQSTEEVCIVCVLCNDSSSNGIK